VAELKIFVDGDDGFQIIWVKVDKLLTFQVVQFYGIAAPRPSFLGSVFEIQLVDFPNKKDKIHVAFFVKRSG